MYSCSNILYLTVAKCDSPLTSDGSGVMVTTGYSDLALEGTNITFNCSSGFLLNGSTMARCAGTGQRKPDPREIKCIGTNFKFRIPRCA